MNKIKVTTTDQNNEKLNNQKVNNQKIKKSTDQYIENILNSPNKSDVKQELLSDIELNKLENKIINQQNKDNYKRPEITYTDKLSKSQIRELLIDYERVTDIKDLERIPPGTHLRYFEMKNKELKFRTGGVLTVNSGLPNYIVLSNGKLSWSVQVAPSIFFRRVTIKQIREEYDKFLFKNDATIKGQQALLSEQSTKIKELLMEIKKLKDIIKKK
jgi:hypothetical protein